MTKSSLGLLYIYEKLLLQMYEAEILHSKIDADARKYTSYTVTRSLGHENMTGTILSKMHSSLYLQGHCTMQKRTYMRSTWNWRTPWTRINLWYTGDHEPNPAADTSSTIEPAAKVTAVERNVPPSGRSSMTFLKTALVLKDNTYLQDIVHATVMAWSEAMRVTFSQQSRGEDVCANRACVMQEDTVIAQQHEADVAGAETTKTGATGVDGLDKSSRIDGV
ncbi:hypothetical protein BD769DRAFT_1397415 [Suillus cothurnatus]|nr:hypothetical protein BD769DRAFT_1397415 [Suillus cothurnatus]